MLFVPIGLWLGAMAMFLVFRPFGREALRSTASTGGLVWRTLARAGLLALAQAITVVLLLHGALGVDWSLLPQTLGFAALLALAFTALHAFLTVWLGRAGLLVSLVLVALQLAASGGLYPVEILSGPFQAISPFLPLTWAVQGMQLIVAGAGGGAVAAAAGVIALFGLIGVAAPCSSWAVVAASARSDSRRPRSGDLPVRPRVDQEPGGSSGGGIAPTSAATRSSRECTSFRPITHAMMPARNSTLSALDDSPPKVIA